MDGGTEVGRKSGFIGTYQMEAKLQWPECRNDEQRDEMKRYVSEASHDATFGEETMLMKGGCVSVSPYSDDANTKCQRCQLGKLTTVASSAGL